MMFKMKLEKPKLNGATNKMDNDLNFISLLTGVPIIISAINISTAATRYLHESLALASL